ncbi:MAG TPA: histidine kinase dimerization/phospho-acceptor domain-containing protein [Candidatus Krumholzibacteriaceae bacterium]|nr:histidine kinase dimerization/phospho-acceptor domain-containing protein [Candidatus Krumholzibacteriaceae bacterium]
MPKNNNIKFPVEVLENLFNQVDQGILIFDYNLNFIYANKRAVALLGVDSQENAGDFIKRSCPEEAILKSREKDTKTTFLETKGFQGKGRKLLGVEFSFRDPEGFYPIYIVMLHDFSDWEKLDRMRTDFISSVSHRLRTPLTSVRNSFQLLCMDDSSLCVKEREKLLEIGMRNIKRLSSSLDELQKIFMVQSEEMNLFRSLVSIGGQVNEIFERLYDKGQISGFELTSCGIGTFTVRSKLENYMVTVADLFRKWIGGNPYILVEIESCPDGDSEAGRGRFEISLKPRQKVVASKKVTLKDFLYYQESHRSLLLERLAGALDGTMTVSSEGVTISIPSDPPFDREKDLVHPLHVIVDKALIEKRQYCLVNLWISGNIPNEDKKNEYLRKILVGVTEAEGDSFVVMDERPLSYLIFFIDRTSDEIDKILRDVTDQLAKSCKITAGEGRSFLKWDIKLKSSRQIDSYIDSNLLKASELV